MSAPLNPTQFDNDAEDVMGALGGTSKRAPVAEMSFGEIHKHMRDNHSTTHFDGKPIGNLTRTGMDRLHEHYHRRVRWYGEDDGLPSGNHEH